MTSKTKLTRVSMIALAAASVLVIRPGAAHAATTASQLQTEINELQAQINALSTQQDAINAQVADNALAMKKLATATKTTQAGWHIADNGSAVPDFTNDKGSEFTLFGQVNIDTAVASVPATGSTKNTQGYAGAANFKRIELGLKGVFNHNFPWEVQVDFSKTTSPLSGVLDVWLGYSTKTPFGSSTTFKLGNQHTPFGFQTASGNTFLMENDVGNTLFQPGRLLGLTGQSYNKNFNFWYGLMGTGVGASCSAATGAESVVPGKCYAAGSTTNTALVSSQFTGAYVFAWNFINTPGHLLSVRNSNAYTEYNASIANAVNDPTFKAGPDLGITGESFISTGALPTKHGFVESPRIDFQYQALTVAAVYYMDKTTSDSYFSFRNHGHVSPTFSSWDVEAQYVLTPGDRVNYLNDQGYYGGLKPKHPVTDGGIGAFQVAARVDEANLSAGRFGVYGGNMTNVSLGLVWVPVDDTRIDLNYVHTLPIGGALGTKGGSSAGTTNLYRGHTSDAIAMRFEVQY